MNFGDRGVFGVGHAIAPRAPVLVEPVATRRPVVEIQQIRDQPAPVEALSRDQLAGPAQHPDTVDIAAGVQRPQHIVEPRRRAELVGAFTRRAGTAARAAEHFGERCVCRFFRWLDRGEHSGDHKQPIVIAVFFSARRAQQRMKLLDFQRFERRFAATQARPVGAVRVVFASRVQSAPPLPDLVRDIGRHYAFSFFAERLDLLSGSGKPKGANSDFPILP